MIPIPPLDGSRVLYGLLPDSLAFRYARFETYGIFILFAIFIFGGSFLGYFIRVPVVIFIKLCNFNYSELEIVIKGNESIVITERNGEMEDPQSAYSVELDIFNGPLDLLLHLIKKK